MIMHGITRTSPKGGPFIGKCIYCGTENLTIADALKECPNKTINQNQRILDAIKGNKHVSI